MTKVNLAYAASKRVTGRFPEVVQLNVVAEKSDTSISNPMNLICRPGLSAFATIGTHPIRAIGQKEGLFSGDLIIPVGQEVYRMSQAGISSAFTGALPGYNRVRVAIGRDSNDDDAARIATGTGLYLVVGTTVTAEDFPEPGGAGASDIEYFKGFWLASQAGTDLVYYIIPGETAWNALDFTSAEYQPDAVVAIRAAGDLIWFLGRVTVQPFYLTGDADNLMAPAPGMNFDHGCKARDTAVVVPTMDASALLYVDNNGAVRMTKGAAPNVISDHGLTEEIRNIDAADLRAAGYGVDNHFYYCLTLSDQGTVVFDLTYNTWTRFSSKGFAYWRAHIICDTGSSVFAADATSNQMWKIEPDVLDDAGVSIPTACTAYRELKEGHEDCWNLTMNCSVGFTDREEAPQISMRLCRDGQTYGKPRFKDLPLTGKYKRLPRWAKNGKINAPFGLWMRFECSDATVKRYSSVSMNVPV